MGIAEQIRVLCARLNISQAELARLVGKSPQGFSGKMKRQSFTVEELEQIADAVGADFLHQFQLKNGEKI